MAAQSSCGPPALITDASQARNHLDVIIVTHETAAGRLTSSLPAWDEKLRGLQGPVLRGDVGGIVARLPGQLCCHAVTRAGAFCDESDATSRCCSSILLRLPSPICPNTFVPSVPISPPYLRHNAASVSVTAWLLNHFMATLTRFCPRSDGRAASGRLSS